METKEIFCYAWHIDKENKEQTTIRVYALDSDNNNVCIRVQDFTPYIFIELPREIRWTNLKVDRVMTELRAKLQEPFVLYDYKPMNSLYYANVEFELSLDTLKYKDFPYVQCVFAHTDHVRSAVRAMFRELTVPEVGKVKLIPHEQSATPILQLISVRKLFASGWLSVKGKRVPADAQTTSCDFEYIISFKNITAIDKPTTPKPKLCGFDIEVYSSIPTSMPKANRPADKIFQISCVFCKQGDEKSISQCLLSLGDPDEKYLENTEVIRCKTEADLLLKFTELIQERNPNVLIGHNIFGFDIKYMYDRAHLLGVDYDFVQLSMLKGEKGTLEQIKWSSSAYKNQQFDYIAVEGRIFADLLPMVSRDDKLSNYKLDTIAKHYLKTVSKDPFTAKQIFKCYEVGVGLDKSGKNPEARARRAMGLVGKYCVKDSYLALRIFEVRTDWIALCEMSKVTNVPIFSLYTQGQQLKVFSQVYKYCTAEGKVVDKDSYRQIGDENYAGAIVFPPVPGLYNMVLPFDFNSLYPTTIIAWNICWSTFVTDEKVPDSFCHVMEWDEHSGCVHDKKEMRKAELLDIIKKEQVKLTSLRAEVKQRGLSKYDKEEYKQRIKNGVLALKPFQKERAELQKCKPKYILCGHRKYRWLKEPLGVLPRILKELLDARSATKKLMKQVKAEIDEMEKNKVPEDDATLIEKQTYCDVLDKRQLALKVSANSAYGAMGVKRGYLMLPPGAMCVTYMGRQSIEKAANVIQTKYGGKLIYGDSVSADTPVLVRDEYGEIYVQRIDELCDKWVDYFGFKPYEPGLTEKEQGYAVNSYFTAVWTNGKWSRIKRVIRHKTDKKMYRVLTSKGCVDVTEDHSLLRENGEQIKPTQASIGENLLHSFPEHKFDPSEKSSQMGFHHEFQETLPCQYIPDDYTDRDIVVILNKFGKSYPDGNHLTITYSQTGLIGDFVQVECRDKVTAQYLYYLIRPYLNTSITVTKGSVSYGANSRDIYRITGSKFTNKTPHAIRKIIPLGCCTGFVYDLETEDGIFQAGIGEIVVKNTDSNYVSFPKLEKTQDCWDHAVKVAKEVSNLFPKPMALAFEDKLYALFLLIAKKRYIYKACSRDGEMSEKLGNKGVLLSRRDNCGFIRSSYEALAKLIFEKVPLEDIYMFLVEIFNILCSHCEFPSSAKAQDGKEEVQPYSDFLITKSIGDMGELEDLDCKDPMPFEVVEEEKGGKKKGFYMGDYKLRKVLTGTADEIHDVLESGGFRNPREFYIRALPAQCQLALKMRARGQLVPAGTRIEYVITSIGGAKAGQYEKIEDIDVFRKQAEKGRLMLDYLYYLKQLSSPVDQLLQISFSTEPGYVEKFADKQYKYRLKREKLMNEINGLFDTQIIIRS